MNRREFSALLGVEFLLRSVPGQVGAALPDISSVPPDLTVPPVALGVPRPGSRVRQTLAQYVGTEVHHALYLPKEWQPGNTYPVIVEYPGNGPYTSPYGDFSSGDVDGAKLGYGISGGHGFIWLTLPCVDATRTKNERWWWGDVEATLDYCREAIAQTCAQFGGDTGVLILCGFSRGGIACNFLGLHDDKMSDIWLAFVTCSHYDGVRRWAWEGSDSASAATRLARLNGRACFIEQEVSTTDIEQYLRVSGVKAPFSFHPLPFHNHTDAWVLRDLPQRRTLRTWLANVIKCRPGTYAVRGRAVDQTSKPMQGIEIRSGQNHVTRTRSDGAFALMSLIRGVHTIRAVAPFGQSSPADVAVTIKDSDVTSVIFRFS